MNLRTAIYNNPLIDSNLFLSVSDHFELTASDFQTLATNGYGPGTLALRDVPKAVIFDALNNWMFKRVLRTDGGGFKAHEAWIAEIKATVDNTTYEIRSDKFASQCRVMFTEADPLHPGSTRDVSRIVTDAAAQAKFCIKEIQLDLRDHGIITSTQGTQRATTFLNQHKTPKGLHYKATPNSPPEQSLELTLYAYGLPTLSFQMVNLKYKTVTEISTIVKAVLASGSLQFLDVSDTTQIANTSVTIKYNDKGGLKGLDEYIQDVIAYGDSSNRRVMFQVWEDRKCFLRSRPTTLGYQARMREAGARIWSSTLAPIPPWRVRAGDYMMVQDFPGPLTVYSDIDSDPRAYLVESTSYDDISGAFDAVPAELDSAELFFGRVVRGQRKVLA